MDISPSFFNFIVNHIFLPPKLPNEEDNDLLQKEMDLLCLVYDTAVQFASQVSTEYRDGWKPILSMLQDLENIYTFGDIDKEKLSESLKNLEPGRLIALHIRAQNAGVVIRRVNDLTMIFDAFEVSSSNHAIMTTKGRLIRQFPGRSVSIPAAKLQEENFRGHIVERLQQMNLEIIPECVPKTREAQSEVLEKRDTIHPGFVTENFMTILEALGEIAPLTTFRKNIRDDVVSNGCRIPWRRSSFWLVLKLSLQHALKRAFSKDIKHDQYKNFMLLLVSNMTNLATTRDTAPDILDIMSSKVGRRSYKLGTQTMDFVSESAMTATKAAQSFLKDTWQDIISLEETTPLPKLAPFTTDITALSLINSREYLQKIISRPAKRRDLSTFEPDSTPRIQLDRNILPSLKTARDPLDRIIVLADLEEWVEEHLPSWSEAPKTEKDCTALAFLIKSYLEIIQDEYRESPQEYSLAILTIVELWVALDKICVKLYTLLGTFKPTIPSTLLEPLLLPRIGQMQRLQKIEQYIDLRDRYSVSRNPYIFEDSHPQSFAVQYYAISEHHQNLKTRIENHAQQKRSLKKAEWEQKAERYSLLKQEASLLSHETVLNNEGYESHSRWCRKCLLVSQYEGIKITPDEWLLPEASNMAQSIVFELDVPEALVAWRDMTWAILHDLGGPFSVAAQNCHLRLQKYQTLSEYAVDRKQRVTLGSYKESSLQMHTCLRFPVDLDNVCLNNGFSFRMLDSVSTTWIQDQAPNPSVFRLCTTKLPSGPYSNLQYAVDSYTHTQNVVISRQANCSPELSISEYTAFGSLRAGERIQWMNILRELGSANLSFNLPAVSTLVIQAALQAGSPSKDEARRISHGLFLEDDFCSKLLKMLERMHQKIEANWKEQETMKTLIAIILREISLTLQPSTRSRAIALLRLARHTTIDWCHDLDASLHETSNEESSQKTRMMILNAATLCCLTYDVDHEHLREVLSHNDDVANLVESSILIFDNTPDQINDLPIDLRRCIRHTWKISQSVEGRLRSLIQKYREGIDKALRNFWENATIARDWSFLPGSNKSWAINHTVQTELDASQSIHYNIISGELLVDGRPLGRIPKDFMKHSLYKRLFGARILRVFASDMQGMSYMTARCIQRHQVHFGMHGNQLLIRTRHDGHILEVVPHDTFVGDLPRKFTESFVHWLDVESGELELRDLKEPWKSSDENWRCFFSPTSPCHLRQPHRRLVDVRSAVTNTIVQILRGLDDGGYIHVTLTDESTIEVELIRLNIRFFINMEGQLESRELDATVDPNQSLHTLHGLEDRLVLRNMASEKRSVLVSFGKVSVKRKGHHVNVAIKKPQGWNVRYFRYGLDVYLQKLRSPQGILSELYLGYLHAVTSFPLPDLFTGRTGTDEALAILRRESLRGCSPLESETRGILEQLSELSPRREFYPEHLQIMQQVSWNPNLSQTSQHDEFGVVVEEIISHARRFAMLYDGKSTTSSSPDRGSLQLLSRARQRNSSIRSFEFGGDIIDSNLDKVYASRDSDFDSERGRRAYQITALIKNWPSQLNITDDLAKVMREWNDVSGYESQLDHKCLGDLINLSFPTTWGSLYNLCRSSKRESDTYNLMFLFSPIVFTQTKAPLIIRTLLACAFSCNFPEFSARPHSFFNLNDNSPDRYKIEQQLSKCLISFRERHPITTTSQRQHLRSLYDKDVSQQIRICVDRLLTQWPCQSIWLPSAASVPLIQRETALNSCNQLFAEWYKNHQFGSHITQVQSLLNKVCCPVTELDRPEPITLHEQSIPWPRKLKNILDLMKNVSSPSLDPLLPPLGCTRIPIPNEYRGFYEELEDIISDLESSSDAIQCEYGKNLHQSFTAFRKSSTTEIPKYIPISMEILIRYRTSLQKYVKDAFQSIVTSLRAGPDNFKIAASVGLFPSITPQSLLGILAGVNPSPIDAGWRQALLLLGEAISMLQRAERLILFSKRDDVLGFCKEGENTGRNGWTAMEFPDWLLMEIENDFTIRAAQARVAREMISPKSGKNSVFQMNMGEGKSSVVIPMVAVALADRSCLTRVITLKPLLRQTSYLLTQRLGGLVNRRLYYAPFSRKTNLNMDVARNLHQIYEECMDIRGVMLALPEHLLSFRLMSRERLPIDRALAEELLKSNQWLHQNARDLLDESDEILDPRFQLVYTVGNQQFLDGQPDRWSVPQSVLSCVDKHLDSFLLHGDIEVDRKDSAFPTITFLRDDAGDRLLQFTLKDIVQGNVPSISFGYCSPKVLCAIEHFIGNRSVDDRTANLIKAKFEDTPHMNVLLLLRGLFAHRILIFALQNKRWMVDYGLDPTRCMMAVPYRAKGVPSVSSEFGHPEVAILVTCLSYYYTGITKPQMQRCLELIFKESDPSDEYTRWCRPCTKLPQRLKDLNSINMEDEDLCVKLFTHLKQSKAVVDFFLSRVVFPHEGKEFLKKISGSGWDIPASEGGNITTGFSGTNDNRFLLPLSIQQHDLPEIHKTNAEVINLLLSPENRRFVSAQSERGQRLSAPSLIKCISQQPQKISVLIDVGAQVLEMKNREVAQEWLKNVLDARAAVYFNEDDEAMVLDRNGHVEHLLASAFHQCLNGCLIYLDEVHTRGVDLRMPIDSCAAINLGPRLCKDKLVQACMRLRNLGQGQSLVFFGSPEQERSIRNVIRGNDKEYLDSRDVVYWALRQTCQITKSMKPLWAMQGRDYCKQSQVCQTLFEELSIPEAVGDHMKVARFWDGIQEPEGLTLSEMYGLSDNTMNPFLGLEADDDILRQLIEAWRSLDLSSIRDSSMHKEQEREISHELEREQQVQRPPPAEPLPHSLDPQVIYFVRHGRFQTPATAFISAFSTMERTSAGQFLDNLYLIPNVLVTEDFTNVVRQAKDANRDEYLRPVNWILSSKLTNELVIISPYEANELIPRLETDGTVHLHVYAPQTTKTMISFRDLDFYSIPASLAEVCLPEISIQGIGLFAGSIYLPDYTKYKRLCSFLGLADSTIDNAENLKISVDRFVDQNSRAQIGWPTNCPFDKCPVLFFRSVISLRLKGQHYLQSHLGSLVNGRLLTEESFCQEYGQ